MLETQFRSVCRLNRLIIVAVTYFTLVSDLSGPVLWQYPAKMGLLGLHAALLVGNEFLMKIMKRLRGAEHRTVYHLSIMLPVVMGIYLATCYALTGSFAIFLLGMFCALEAYFLDQPGIAKLMGALQVGILLAGLPFGYPHPLVFTPVNVIALVLGLGICVYYYGHTVSRLVRAYFNEVGKLQSIAATDVLTGLTNRRQFNTRLQEEIARARRHGTPLSLALFDLDDFKRLNDFYGHPVGDRILRELGKLIRQNIRESDLPARYGGEEFALILPETREAEAYELLERIRLLVAQTVFCLPDNPLTVTISVGVAQLDPRQHTAFELVELADKALYESKRQGKNRVFSGSTLHSKILLDKSQDIPLAPKYKRI